MNSKIINSEGNEILMNIAEILQEVSKDEGIYPNYAKVCWGAMELLHRIWGNEYRVPIDVVEIYQKINIEVRMVDLNGFMGGADAEKVNRIIGKVSIRPDYFARNVKTTVYVDEEASPTDINYALAHELCHLILNYHESRYTDDYCIMPMLPKKVDELVADAFAIFLLLPFDRFLDTFVEYIDSAKASGDIPIETSAWLNYLSSVSAVPYYYVACGYQQIRHVAFLIYKIYIAGSEELEKYKQNYAEEVFKLYNYVKDKLTNGNISLFYQ